MLILSHRSSTSSAAVCFGGVELWTIASEQPSCCCTLEDFKHLNHLLYSWYMLHEMFL